MLSPVRYYVMVSKFLGIGTISSGEKIPEI